MMGPRARPEFKPGDFVEFTKKAAPLHPLLQGVMMVYALDPTLRGMVLVSDGKLEDWVPAFDLTHAGKSMT